MTTNRRHEAFRRAVQPRALAAILSAVTLVSTRVLAQQPPTPPAPPPKLAALGSCRLAGGTTIQDCRVAYRTYGRLAPARDNVIIVPTFFAGRSEDHQFMLGAFVDTTRHHVIIVDAFADGHSSSPSNTVGGSAPFAGLTIGDMVDAQHRLLTEHLGIRHVRAIVGISMGALQTYEWAVRYPDFMDAAVPLFGSPRPTTYDRLIYKTWLRSAEDVSGAAIDVDSAWMHASRAEALFMRTSRFVNDSGDAALERTVRETAAFYRTAGWSLADYIAQLRAILAHDISARFGRDLAKAAGAVHASMFIVWTPDDMVINPRESATFARLVRADTLAVRSACGHAVFWCEHQRVGREVRKFLSRAPRLVVTNETLGKS